jgi:hypothetical protein
MPDLERQLAQYGTVLRDRAPAVRIDEVESRLHRPPSSHRPIRAAVAGAVLALASIGAVFVGGVLVDVLSDAPSTHQSTAAAAGGAAPGPVAMAVIVGGGAAAVLLGAAAVGLKRRYKSQEPQRLAKSRERRKKKMQTIERPVAPVEKLARNNRFLIIGLVVAILAAAGLGAWLIVDNTRTGLEADIAALVYEYGTAFEANDGEALAAVVTEDFRVLAGNGVTYSLEEAKSWVETLGDFPNEPVNDLLITEPGPAWTRFLGGGSAWHVAFSDSHGMQLFYIDERDGTLLIRFHETWRAGF